MGDRKPRTSFRGLLGRQEQRRKGAWGGDPREARAKGCDEEGPRGWEGLAKEVGAGGSADQVPWTQEQAVLGRVRWVPSRLCWVEAAVGCSNTDAVSVLKCD